MAKMTKEEEIEALKAQKAQLEADINAFHANYTDKIKHKGVGKDSFDELFVFGNFYQLALDAYPQLQMKWEEYREKYRQLASEEREAIAGSNALVSEILGSKGVEIKEGQVSRESSCSSVFVGGKLIDSEEEGQRVERGLVPRLQRALKKLESESPELFAKYKKLQEKLKDEKVLFKTSRNKNIEEQIKKLESSSPISEYIAIVSTIEEVEKNSEKIDQSNAEAYSRYKKIGDYYKNEGGELRDALGSKSESILALAYIDVYKRNYELLRMMPEGAKESLEQMMTQGVEYYARADIKKAASNIDKWLKVDKIASRLHEGWRETRKNEDGTFEPRWKKVTDSAFINKVKKMKQLPPTIRIVDGVVEQDIANTEFSDLCLDYQLENFEAAIVAHEVAKTNYTHDQVGMIGDKIHKEWLKRNPWAKGSDLDVAFKDLILSEKLKDLIHYNTAKEVNNESQPEA